MDNDVGTQPIRTPRCAGRLISKKVRQSEHPLRIRRESPFAMDPHMAMEDVMLFQPDRIKVEKEPDGPMEFVELLQTHSAAVTYIEWMHTRLTTLHYACAKGWGEYAELLVARGSDVGVTDANGCLPLWYAVNAGCMRCVRAVCGSGLGDATGLVMDGYLNMSVGSGDDEMVRALLAAGAGVGEWELDGRRALRTAVIQERMEMMRMLVDAGVDPAATVGGESVIETAWKSGQDDIAMWLAERLAERGFVA